MRPQIRDHRSLVVLLAALFALDGCAFTGRDAGSPREVFSVGYENLSERYIQPVDLGEISVAGLNRLRRFDPAVDISKSQREIALFANARPAGRWESPKPDDARGWANLVAAAMDAMRTVSVPIASHSQNEISDTVFGGAMMGFDRYSRYSGPEAARRSRAAREGFGGLGISIAYEDGITRVRRVQPDTPASRAGLRDNDRITHVDGHSIVGASQERVIALLRGKIGTTVRLGIERGKQRKRGTIVSIQRGLIVVPTVIAKTRGDILHLKIIGFNQGTAMAVGRALEKAERQLGQALKGVILDLRNNPGGLLDQAVAVADLFLVDGPVISTIGRHPKSFQAFDATWGQMVADVPVALLINGKSASAAEIVAVALRDRGRAVVIGSASYGKGTVQTIVRLPNDGELTLTWARMVAPSGFKIDTHGIIPAICTSGDTEGVARLLKALRRRDPSRVRLIDRQLRARLSRRRSPDLARAACPPDVKEPASDLEIARHLLHDRQLYARTLDDGRPPIAGTGRADTAKRP